MFWFAPIFPFESFQKVEGRILTPNAMLLCRNYTSWLASRPRSFKANWSHNVSGFPRLLPASQLQSWTTVQTPGELTAQEFIDSELSIGNEATCITFAHPKAWLVMAVAKSLSECGIPLGIGPQAWRGQAWAHWPYWPGVVIHQLQAIMRVFKSASLHPSSWRRKTTVKVTYLRRKS